MRMHHTLASFASHSYLGLEHDLRLRRGAIAAIEQYGVAVNEPGAASASPLHAEAEQLLGRIFDRPVVLVASSMHAHAAALRAVIGATDAVLFDERIDPAVQFAFAGLVTGARCERVPHGDGRALESAIRHARSRGADRIWYLADHVFASGDRLQVADLVTMMASHPELHAYLDDSRGTSWEGARGGGTLLGAGLPPERTVIAAALGGFGCAGAVIAVPDVQYHRSIVDIATSTLITPALGAPILGVICASARIHLGRELHACQRELLVRIELARDAATADHVVSQRLAPVHARPTPTFRIALGTEAHASRVQTRLRERGFIVDITGREAVAFTITRCHSASDIRALIAALAESCADIPVARCNNENDPHAATNELARLSRRERQTLDLLSAGLATKQVAAQMQISVHTAHEYVKGMYRKLGVSSRGELMARLLRESTGPRLVHHHGS
jgi:7-keto-8-aminopelargonate synthetase-like enzyme/DNA-binding CsgD family transcriptional regulator